MSGSDVIRQGNIMQTIAIVNEKGGTGKTTTAVNLAAALGEIGKNTLLVDLDGQAATSRWLGVEDDTRLADAILTGSRVEPLKNLLPGVSLAPGCGKLDSVAHDLRPTQGGQLRKVLSEHTDYDYTLIDSPPSLGNKLIGNALLAATHAIAPVEPSILALDGLGILLTTLGDIRDGFDHNIILIGALGCRYDSRTKLSRLVLEELRRALPGRVFQTVIRETVRMQECPASGTSILEFSPRSVAAKDYLAMARELIAWPPKGVFDESIRQRLAEQCALDPSHAQPTDMGNLRKDAIAAVMEATGMQPRFHDDEIKQLNDLDEELVEVDQDEQVEASAEDQQQEGEVQPVAADEGETWTEPAEAEIESESVAVEPVFEEETETPVEAQAIEQPADEAPDADSETESEAWTVPVSAEADASTETVDIESDHIEAPDELTFGKRLARTTVGPAILFVGLVLLGLIVASGGRPSPQMASADAAADSWQKVTLEQTDAASVVESPETLA
ncbi:hypothetical protein LCGC14_1831650, partial [marine sediment metagenome]